MGFEPRQDPSSLETVNEFTKRMESTTEEAKSTIHKAQEDMTRYYNRRRSLAPVFKPGDRVYLDTSDIRTTRPSPKLSHRRLGPFEIERQVGPLAYRLKLPHGLRQLHLVFNVVKLSAAPDDLIPGRKPQAPLPPIVVAEYYRRHPAAPRHICRMDFDILFKSGTIASRCSNLGGGVNVRGPLTRHSRACSSPPERPGSRSNIT